MSLNFQKYIDKLKTYGEKTFLLETEASKKISFFSFYKEIAKDKFRVSKLDNNSVYFLKVENSIKSLLLIATFLYYKKKILLIPAEQKNNKILKKNIFFKSVEINIQGSKIKKKIISSLKLKEKNFDILIMSSGSTGKSKIVKLDLKKSLINSYSMGKILKFDINNVHYLVMPIYHVNSLFFSFFSSIIFPQKIILSKKFDVFKFWKIVKKNKVKTTSLSPTIVKLLNMFKDNYVNCDLSIVLCASSFLPKKDYFEFYNNFKLYLSQGYGLSEATNFSCLMPTSQKKIKILNNYFKKEGYITIGSSIYGNKVSLNGKGKYKELVVEGDFLSNGYYGDKNIRKEKIYTGDLGYQKTYNKETYTFIVSRKKEIIKFKDETIYPIDIENYILSTLNIKNNFFCFGFEYQGLTNIACFVDKKNLSKESKQKIIKLKNSTNYNYKPKFFFLGDISNFQTKTFKPRRSFISKIVASNFTEFVKKYPLI